MKSILNIFGSPHKNGVTAILNNCVLEHINQYGLYVIYAYDRNVKPCIDCKKCAESEGCIFGDMDDIDLHLRQSDIIIIATPIYNMCFPSPLKAILDRMQRYFMARFSLGLKPPIEKHKKMILLATCGCDNKDEASVIEKQLKRICTVINADLVGTILWSGTDSDKFDVELNIFNTHNKIKEILEKINY